MSEMDGETPQSSDPIDDTNPLDLLEFDLPVSEEVPPGEVQARLEAPTGFHSVLGLDDVEVIVETDPIAEPGVEKVWTELDELAEKKNEEKPTESALAPENQAGGTQ